MPVFRRFWYDELMSAAPRVWALLAVLPLLAVGCGEQPCGGSCPAGQVCDARSGKCRTPGCGELGCPAGEQCNPDTDRCEPQVDCLVQGCPAGQTCDTLTRLCEARSGCELDGCPADRVCDPALGICVMPPCLRDRDCPAGMLCGSAGRCQVGCRLDHPCNPGWVCLFTDGAGGTGQCIAGCRQDTDCAFGQVCQGSIAPGRLGTCLREPPCSRRSDCRSDETCERGRCVRGPCTEGIPCAAGELCDVDTGECRLALCTDDLFEENDTPGQAAVLLPQSYSNLVLCTGDTDVFRLRVGRRDQLRATLRFAASGADLDLALLDEEGKVLAAARGTGNSEEATFAPWWDGELLVQVTGFSGSQSTYSLDLVVGTSPCPEDGLSPNHRFQQAAAVQAGEPMALRLCPGRDDWLVLAAAEGYGLEARLRPLQEPGQGVRLALALLDAAGGVTEVASRTGEEALLEMPVLWRSGGQLLRVRGEGLPDEGLAYRLTTHLVPGGLSCEDHQLEPNDSAAEAIPLEPRLYAGLLLCAANPDWYSVDLPDEGASLEVVLAPASGIWRPGDAPQLVLVRPADLAQLATGVLENGKLVLRHGPGVQPGSHLIAVFPPLAPHAPQPYSLLLQVSSPPPCLDDPLEGAAGNDTVETAAVLQPGMGAGLRLCPASRVDHYSFAVPPQRLLRARLRLAEAAGARDAGLEMALLDAKGALLHRAEPAGADGGLDLFGESSGPDCCLLRVAAAALPHQGLGYRMELELDVW